MSERSRGTPAATPAPTSGAGGTAKRRIWLDPRFVIGIVLVAAAIAGVSSLVSTVDTTVDVVAAREQLTPGQLVTAADLATASVRIVDAQKLYLSPDAIPEAGVVITRDVAPGELVPATAVGSASAVQLASVILPLRTPLASSVGPGSRIDVWAAREAEDGTFAAPTVLVSGATVVQVIQEEGIMASQAGRSVEVLVPRDAVARALEAVANNAAIDVIGVDLPVGE